jgi:asparaginyl-tRNA synthetase
VKGIRKLKDHVFLELNDGLSHHRLQVVLPAAEKPKDLSIHSSVDVCGVLCTSPKNAQILELHPTTAIRVLGPCDQITYPFAGKVRYQPEYIRQFIHLRPKTNK